MRYERTYTKQNTVLQLTLAAFILAALLLLNATKPEMAGMVQGSQSVVNSIAIR